MIKHSQPLTILDTTLREGEQSAGVCFSLEEKIHIAEHLKKFGVGLIEIGHPGISENETLVCQKICNSVSGVEFLVHARAHEADIRAAYQTQAPWVGIWISYNDISLKTKFTSKSREWIQEQVQKSITLAKDLGMKVRFTIEDASRTDWPLIQEIGDIAIQSGADRISLADTVGIWHPKECREMIEQAVNYFSVPLEVHLHNDLGLAQANAIAAIEAGAQVIDASILGIGERAGICDLFSLTASLEKFYDISSFHWEYAAPLAQAVSRIAHFKVLPHHPIVGNHVFTHASPYHIKATQSDTAAYEGLKPENYAANRKTVLQNRERKNQKRFLKDLKIAQPFIKGSAELAYHRDGVGKRWVLMDSRIDERTPVYTIERIFDQDYSETYEAHVDSHAHHCDSFFVFMGDNPDGTGLEVSVTFGEGENADIQKFESPASVFIPAYVVHTYQYIRGKGRFLNIVLSANYNQSLV